jgi:TP53 regulating kinase-like protein
MTIIAQGAEAILRRQENGVVKERIAKDYRLPEMDMKLRRARTRREAKILERLQDLDFPAPRLHKMDDSQMIIHMDFIDGPQVKEILHNNPVILSKEIGHKIGILHANNIVHADLTTSNMIHSNEVHLIDFGLSFVSSKVEDKAVDLHLLDRALESKHHEIYKQCIAAALDGYKEGNPDWQTVFARLEKVAKRGRNKK